MQNVAKIKPEILDGEARCGEPSDLFQETSGNCANKPSALIYNESVDCTSFKHHLGEENNHLQELIKTEIARSTSRQCV